MEELAKDLVKLYPTVGDSRESDGGFEIWYYYSSYLSHPVGLLQERLQNQRKIFLKKLLKKIVVTDNYVQKNTDMGWESDDDPVDDISTAELLIINSHTGAVSSCGMRDSVRSRRLFIRTKSLYEVLVAMPRLVDTEGMITQDFDVWHPKLKKCFYEFWPKAAEYLIEYSEETGVNFKKLGIKLAVSTMTSEQKSVLGLQLIPHILPFCGKKLDELKEAECEESEIAANLEVRKRVRTEKGKALDENRKKRRIGLDENKKGRKTVRATTIDARDSLIVFKPGNIKEVLANKHSTQPFIVAVGAMDYLKVTEYFVILAGAAVPCGSVFYNAVDTCFKTFQLFDLEYPEECKAVWTWIEHSINGKAYPKGTLPANVKALAG